MMAAFEKSKGWHVNSLLCFCVFFFKKNIFTTFSEEQYWKIGHIFCLRLMPEDSKLHHQWIWLYIIHDGCVTSNLPGMPVVYIYLGKNIDKVVFSRGENFYVLANEKSHKICVNLEILWRNFLIISLVYDIFLTTYLFLSVWF